MGYMSPLGLFDATACLLSRRGIVMMSCLAMLSSSCSLVDALGGDDSGGGIVIPPPDTCSSLPGIVLHLPFDEGIGNLATDVSGTGNDGSLVNLNDADWVAGRVGNALDFDGKDDFVTIGANPTINDLPAMSMCAWIEPRAISTLFPAIADKSDDSFVGGWNFYIQEGNRLGFLTNRRAFAAGDSIELGIWQHVCATWDGSDGPDGIALYVNGLQIPIVETGSNGDATDSDARRDLQIGRVNDGSFPFDGLIDDYQLYARVLAPSEIAAVRDCGDF